jgi:hypothetical protein
MVSSRRGAGCRVICFAAVGSMPAVFPARRDSGPSFTTGYANSNSTPPTAVHGDCRCSVISQWYADERLKPKHREPHIRGSKTGDRPRYPSSTTGLYRGRRGQPPWNGGKDHGRQGQKTNQQSLTCSLTIRLPVCLSTRRPFTGISAQRFGSPPFTAGHIMPDGGMKRRYRAHEHVSDATKKSLTTGAGSLPIRLRYVTGICIR